MPLLDSPPLSPPPDPLKVPLELIEGAIARMYTLDLSAEERSAITDHLIPAAQALAHFRSAYGQPVHCVARGGPFDGSTVRFSRRDARFWVGTRYGTQGVCSEIPLSELPVFQDGTDLDGCYVPHVQQDVCHWHPFVLPTTACVS